jgi:hypothetical protein
MLNLRIRDPQHPEAPRRWSQMNDRTAARVDRIRIVRASVEEEWRAWSAIVLPADFVDTRKHPTRANFRHQL